MPLELADEKPRQIYNNVRTKERIKVSEQIFDFAKFVDFGSKEVEYQSCSFKYCVFDRAYMRKCRFIHCDFTGAKFLDSNFKDAIFEGCKFDYTFFKTSLFPASSLLHNLPGYENTRRELARALRANYLEIGDAEATRAFFRVEMDATADYLRKAAEGKGSYYSYKYPGFFNRCRFQLKSMLHTLGQWLWGHGESPLSLLRSALVIQMMFFCIFLFTNPRIADGKLWPSAPWAAKLAMLSFLGIGGFDSAGSFLTVFLVAVNVLVGYTVLGLFVTILIRRFAGR